MAKKSAKATEEPLEKQLWKSADKLRKNIDAAEYNHVVLGLIFLKYISDAFEELYDKLKANQTQIRTLVSLRDTLLHKLISGEIRVNI